MPLLLNFTDPVSGRKRAVPLRGGFSVGRELPPGHVSLGAPSVASRHAEIAPGLRFFI